ncbi:oxidoreductase [Mycobacteroides abscessus]|uniref:oxidoreductase n=1 Tax=Mycobacteroides abscessus TaxID=36809 RepID=UPI000C256497|nr:oxidoreductase [Mycobacteroides abscessus]
MAQHEHSQAAIPSAGPSVAIVGPGAIGTTVAAALHEVGRTPLLCGRRARPRLQLRADDGLIVVPGPVLVDPAQDVTRVDLVILAVKSTQVQGAAAWLSRLCHPGTVVCVLQNGVEQQAAVTPYVPGCLVVPAVVWFPAQVQPDESVWLRAKPCLTVPDVPAAGVVLDALRDTRCSVEAAADFTSVAWRKLLQNAVAGLMALSGRRSGMFGRPDISRLSLDYLHECLAVARAEGAHLADDVPQAILDTFRAHPTDLGSSILVDREANLPLEWDTRNGVIPRRGRAHGLPTPISDIVVPLLAAASDGPG